MVIIDHKDIVFPRKVIIGPMTYNVIADPKTDGGSFDSLECKLTIGTKSLKKDPTYVWSIINHEVMEIVCATQRVRYDDPSVEGDYKFFMSHKEFENCMSEFSKVIVQFLKLK